MVTQPTLIAPTQEKKPGQRVHNNESFKQSGQRVHNSERFKQSGQHVHNKESFKLFIDQFIGEEITNQESFQIH